MARPMPPLPGRFSSEVDVSLQLADMGERIRARCPEVARDFGRTKLEAFYELAYLRIFMLWEDFLEQSFLRYLCGYASRTGPAGLIRPKFRKMEDAERNVLGNARYVSWASPSLVSKRSQAFMSKGLHELIINSNLARLEAFAFVRHRIAHSSKYSSNQFNAASMTLAGRRYPKGSPGKFLRDKAVSQPIPERWLHHIAEELKALALQICP